MGRLRARLAAFGRDTGGNIALLFAGVLPVLVFGAAFAVDEAALYHERRVTQSLVDLAAIAAARDPANGEAIARAVLEEGGRSELDLSVTPGRYSADPALEIAARFTPDATPFNAVRVGASHPGTLHFARAWAAAPVIGAEAVASATPEIAFSIGSRLARLDGGIANQVLGGLLGANVAISAVSYTGLANARVGLFSFLDALALEMDADAATFSDLLALSATRGQIASALAATLTGTERSAANAIASSLGNSGAIPLSQLFSLGDLGRLAVGTGTGAALSAELSALELLGAAASLGSGTRQLSLGIPINVPGLVSLTTHLAIGEPPQGGAWYGLGPTGTVLRTAQIRLRFSARLLGGPVLLGAGITVPFYLEIAHAEAVATAAVCPTGPGDRGSATILARPGIARLALGHVGDPAFASFSGTPNIEEARLLHVPILLSITASASAAMGNTQPTTLSFSSADIAAGTARTARTSDFTQSLTGSLLASLNPTIRPLGLGIGLSPLSLIRSTLAALLTPLGAELDRVIGETLGVLGLKLGEVDVIVHGVRCTTPVLVR